MLAALAGAIPSGDEINVVAAAHVVAAWKHVLRSKISVPPPAFGAESPKLSAFDVNETKRPLAATDGLELGALAGITPSADETRIVEGTQEVDDVGSTPLHVSVRKIWGVTPSSTTFVTRLVAKDTKATNLPSGLTEGLKLSPLPADVRSPETETRNVEDVVVEPEAVAQADAVVHAVRQYTCRFVPFTGTFDTRLVAVDVKAMNGPPDPPFTAGSVLAPLAAVPEIPTLWRSVSGVHPACPRHVSRRKILLPEVVTFAINVLEFDANATKRPSLLPAGPTVERSGVVPEQVGPHKALFG